MASASSPLDRVVTALIPSLSRSLAEQFDVFRVMHHGTHEKQLSNVFAWLLRENGTHDLGDAFQRTFVEHVNRDRAGSSRLPVSGYRVMQEVDTSRHGDRGKDIADIVLTSPSASIVVENFETSDGHCHDYWDYLAYGVGGGKACAVVLLCARRTPERQVGGWENAVVVTYAELLDALREHIAGNAPWGRANPQQRAFLDQMFQHFLEGPAAMNTEERIAFIKTMCETGESARYGYRPQDRAAEEFATLVAQHATRQFEEGRETLAAVKGRLRDFAVHTLIQQLNASPESGGIRSASAPFQGKWEWCVKLERADALPAVFLEFGPTAVAENTLAPRPCATPDYSRVFVTRQAGVGDGIDQIIQTEVGLDEVLDGLSPEDVRLRDAVLEAMRAG